MNRLAILGIILFSCGPAIASQTNPFFAQCKEGETHRYDGGNGLNISGTPAGFKYGWITEKWGGLDITWTGGENIRLGNTDYVVLSGYEGIISAVKADHSNIYSFMINVPLGQAVYTQVNSTAFGENRAIKVRSQNLTCSIKPIANP